MHSTRYRWQIAILALVVIAAMTLVACGGDPDEVAVQPTDVPPTPTNVVIEVTAAPIPTETPIPTPTMEPTIPPEPTVGLSDDAVEKLKAETTSQPMVEFPSSMMKGSTPLGSDEALAHWEEFISGTRSFAFNDSLLWEVCSGGEGTWLYEVGSPAFTGAKFEWELKSDAGGSWNSAIIVIKMQDQNLFDLMNYAGGDGLRVGLPVPKAGEPSGYYESATCGSTASSNETFTGEMVNNDTIVGSTNYPEGHPLAGQDPELANTLSVVIDGTIESPQLGSGTVDGEVTVDLTELYTGGCSAILEGSEGKISFTAEDGDVLNMVMTTNQLCGETGEFTGVYEIVGGTGRFATAEGVIEASSFPVPGEPSVNTLTGSISY